MIENQSQSESVVSALADSYSRRILTSVAESPRSVSELVEECSIPTATAYRKVKTLVELGLVDEQVRIRSTGRNVSEYVLRIDSVSIEITDDGAVKIESSAAGENIDISDIPAVEVPSDTELPSPDEEKSESENPLQTLFVGITGTREIVERQDSEPSSRDIRGSEASLSEYVATVVTEDGLEDSIGDSELAERN